MSPVYTGCLMIVKLLTLIATASTLIAHAATTLNPTFDRLEGDTLHVTWGGRPHRIMTGLKDVSFLGFLTHPDASAPYLIFTGAVCQNCGLDPAVYLIKPDGDGRLSEASLRTHFVHPGRILDSKTRALVFDSRAFFGRCLPGRANPHYVVFQREKVDRRSALQSSVFIAEAGPERLSEQLIERRPPGVHTALNQVRAKQCTEINGRNRIGLGKVTDLNKRSEKIDPNADEDDAPTKESQTDKDLPASPE